MAESPTYTVLRSVVPNEDAEAVGYRSVPGRAGAHDRRRIDVSSSVYLRVTFYRLRQHERHEMQRIMLGRFIVARGVPLIWPVPSEAIGDDVYLTVENWEGPNGPAGDVHIMDHWRST